MILDITGTLKMEVSVGQVKVNIIFLGILQVVRFEV